eukprot:TRINITY_DN9629_c0_g1_i1.p1 TRINITY_DN9629_c0_g1~~TRINITY_DN9629_c0_g1_i1.p1  ORF type:complete len:1131 (+),score=294.71 TRINITY_DN9629_c0_g1_i1:80-3472(+)
MAAGGGPPQPQRADRTPAAALDAAGLDHAPSGGISSPIVVYNSDGVRRCSGGQSPFAPTVAVSSTFARKASASGEPEAGDPSWSVSQRPATDDDADVRSRSRSAGSGVESPNDLARLEEELSKVELTLVNFVMDLSRIPTRGLDVDCYERAVTRAINCLRERHVNDSESRPVSRRPSATSAGGSMSPRVETLIGLCNPMLDMSLRVDAEFLAKYALAADGWAAATPETLEIFGFLDENPATQYIPGGSGMNTLRVAQWILETPGATTFVGATGRDDFGRRLRKATEEEAVAFPCIEIEDEPTGTCAVLLTGESRSLVANLGAGGIFKPEWLTEKVELNHVARGAGLYYVTGFFLRTSPETVRALGQMATSRQKELALNMSAAFVCECFADLFRSVLPVVDLLFGNAEEACALAKALKLCDTDNVRVVAKALQEYEKSGRPRTVIITRGPDNVVVAAEDGVTSFDTTRLPPEQVIDTNGAGDAFAGGFLAKRLQGATVAECVRTGQWAASVIIGQPGCTVPPCAAVTAGLPGAQQFPGQWAASPAAATRRPSLVSHERRGSLPGAASPMLCMSPSAAVAADRRRSNMCISLLPAVMMADPRSNPARSFASRRQSEHSVLSRSGSMATPGTLLGLCNPLLDMSLRVDHAFLEKHGLAPNGWAAATSETLGIFEAMASNPETVYTPGGSGMNTLRVAQWILETPGATTFIGTTGADDFGKTLHKATEAEGVAFPVIQHPELPTGTCAVLLTGDERSLVANLGASAAFEVQWLRERTDLQLLVESAGAFYVTGFFLRTSPDTVAHLALLAQVRDRELCLNMSAPFVCEGSVHLFRDALPKVDVLFGNSEEAFALAKALGADPGTDCDAVARRLAQIPRTPGCVRGRTVVITQGPGPVIVATDDGVVQYDTRELPQEQVIDTNGAGDAFAGGFLAKRLRGAPVGECVRMGQWAATIIIGQPGCTLPPKPADQMPGFESSLLDATVPAHRMRDGGPDSPALEKRVQITEPQPASPARLSPKASAASALGRRPSIPAGQALKVGHKAKDRRTAPAWRSSAGRCADTPISAFPVTSFAGVCTEGSAPTVAASTPLSPGLTAPLHDAESATTPAASALSVDPPRAAGQPERAPDAAAPR